MKRTHFILHFVIAATIATLLFPPAFAQSKDPKKDPEKIGERDVGSGVNFYSLEKEIALGKQLAQEVDREAKLVDDPIAAEYVNRMAQKIARNSDVKVPVIAKLIDSPQVNAFALPGGFLFVNTGLILKAETEAELAGPIAHELAHVAARHGTRQASRGQLANWASLPLIFMGGWPGFAIRQGVGLAIPVAFLKFSRGFEEEADLLAVQYVYKAGYDPTAFVDFFERMAALERKQPDTFSEIFRSHPNMSNRIKATQQTIEQLLRQQPMYIVSTSEFGDVRRRLAAMHERRTAEPPQTGPTLRRPAERGDGDERADQDERPTLKRRP